ncbi:hypothetical protein U1Q18_027872 [Sarracenia purpurea var. burkii]
MTDTFLFDSVSGSSTDSSTVTVVDSCNSSVSGNEPQSSGNISCRSYADALFSGELCVPYDDLGKLEWLSNFVEYSFSNDDLQNFQLISATSEETNFPVGDVDICTPRYSWTAYGETLKANLVLGS